MGARKIFSKRGGKFGDAKQLTTFLVVALKTQVFLRDTLFSLKKLTTFLVVTLKNTGFHRNC